jgi:hypothetical protein
MDEEMWQEEWPVTGSDKGLVGEIEREMNMDERDLGIDPTTASEQPHTDPIPVQVDYDGAEPVSTPAEPSHRLSKVQYPPTVANMAKTKKITLSRSLQLHYAWANNDVPIGVVCDGRKEGVISCCD